MQEYNYVKIEQQAQDFWQKNKTFEVVEDPTKEKFYCLSMLPYPSGRLHMGHVRNYSIGDVISRYQKMIGKNVMQPIGWDAFGLPAENAALKNKVAPDKWTLENIKYMKKQFIQLGFGYDWSRELATCAPDYYKWEQWFFIKLFKKGLVYKKMSLVNWDPVDKTVLANEQVIDGRGWRSNALVEKKQMPGWFMKITDYAQELLDSLDDLPGWPDAVKTMQRNWIGKSTGVEVVFNTIDSQPIEIYTTRPDTIMGATYLAIAAEHPLALIAAKTNKQIAGFIKVCANIKTNEASIETIEKAGIDSGIKCIHPISGEEICVWIANFVLAEYGTGAVMCVPAHDERDYDFAKKYNINIVAVIKPEVGESNIETKAFTEKGVLFNSGEFDNLSSDAAFSAIATKLEAKKLGQRTTNYRLRDWGVSRQRYWGSPIPIVNCEKCGSVAALEQDLPITLTQNNKDNKVPCPTCGAEATRETDTFDTFFESSWYFARYACADNDKAMLDDRANYWLAVDQYVGGIEHAVLHLLYARFFNKLLRDEGLIKNDEPFTNLLTQGMVLKDGAKMSKSKNNTVDPAAMISKYGADTVRVFILFAAPPTQDLEWQDSGLEGCYRFINKVYRLVAGFIADNKTQDKESQVTQELIKAQKNMRHIAHTALNKITDDISRRHSFNTVIATIMELSNSLYKFDYKDNTSMLIRLEVIEIILKTLSPIAPHVCHYLWRELGNNNAIVNESWPQVDIEATKQEEVQIIVQVNGKLRAKIIVAHNSEQKIVEKIVLAQENVIKFIDNKQIIKTIFVANKLVNIVVK